MMFDLIAFDADDTLWHNETLYAEAQGKFKELLSSYHSLEWIEHRLYETEMRNLEHFGYGIKAFMLSMIETAIELTEGRIQGSEIEQIIAAGKKMLRAEVLLFDHVEDTLADLSQAYPLMIITKGDLLDQQSKISRSGIAKYFRYVEVISDKTKEAYQQILSSHNVDPARFVMVGNSLKSDILPIVELGGTAVYIPYALTWAHENDVKINPDARGYHVIAHIGLLPEVIEELVRNS